MVRPDDNAQLPLPFGGALAAPHVPIADGAPVASEVCTACHADLEGHHPSGVLMPVGSPDFYPPPPHMELLDGKVECSTCHDVKGEGYAMLRVAGLWLCASCHIK